MGRRKSAPAAESSGRPAASGTRNWHFSQCILRGQSRHAPGGHAPVRYAASRGSIDFNTDPSVNQTCAPCLRDRQSHFRTSGARRLDLSRTLYFDCVRDAFPQYRPFPASSCRPAVNQKAREFEVGNTWLRECWGVRGVSPERDFF